MRKHDVMSRKDQPDGMYQRADKIFRRYIHKALFHPNDEVHSQAQHEQECGLVPMAEITTYCALPLVDRYCCANNHVWSYDFVADRTHDGKAFRMLCVIDEFTRKSIAIRVGPTLGPHWARDTSPVTPHQLSARILHALSRANGRFPSAQVLSGWHPAEGKSSFSAEIMVGATGIEPVTPPV